MPVGIYRDFPTAIKWNIDGVVLSMDDYSPEAFVKWDKELESGRKTGFSPASTHILAREDSEAALRKSLAEGRAYVANDQLADPSGFAFAASNYLGLFQMGDTIPLFMDARFTVLLPIPAKIKIIHNGKTVSEGSGAKLEYNTVQPGYYRIEAWLEVDGRPQPWIISNPIYVTATSGLKLPPGTISDTVDARRDISYLAGKPEDEAKHKLDVYTPKGKTNLPVFFFIHGGAWKQGDRLQYPALGNKLAEEGIAVVVPSYRLAPANQHPAQIDDVRAAFQWTLAHLKEFGGDPTRVYVGGHSAGGHLAALLALTEPGIKGVAALSGVYDVTEIDNVFTTDPAVRKAASPLTHVKPGAPEFTLTYCQWDYLALPQQASQFAAALKDAGVKVNLVYVPGESHISEIIHAINDLDPTLAALKQLLR